MHSELAFTGSAYVPQANLRISQRHPSTQASPWQALATGPPFTDLGSSSEPTAQGFPFQGAGGTGQPHLTHSLLQSAGHDQDLLSPTSHCCVGGSSLSCHHSGPHFPHRNLEQTIAAAPRLKAPRRRHKAACFFPCVGRRLAQCCFSNH